MGREVNTTQPYQDKLVKLVPTEIVGAYMVLAGMLSYGQQNAEVPSSLNVMASVGQIQPGAHINTILIQFVFVVLLVATPLYLVKASKVKNTNQIIVTTVSYVIWVYTLGGPFVVWGLYYPIVGSVILVLWSVISPLVVTVKQS